MDRRKAEARSHLETLKQECDITTDLLNKLVQVCSQHVEDISNLDSKGFRMYSKYFLAVLQFQSVSIQKIIEWNIDLEEFLTEKGPRDLKHYGTFNSTNGSLISLFECETRSESVASTLCSSFVQSTPKTDIILAINNADGEIKPNPECNVVEDVNVSPNTEIIIAKVKSDIEKPIMGVVPLEIHTEIEVDGRIHSECDNSREVIDGSLSTSPETIIGDNDDVQTLYSALNDSISSSEYFCSLSSLSGDKIPTDSEDVSSYYAEFPSDAEEKEKPKQTVTDSKSLSYWKGKESKQSETDSESKQREMDSESFSYREGKVKPKQSEMDSKSVSYRKGKESKQREMDSESFSYREGKVKPKQSKMDSKSVSYGKGKESKQSETDSESKQREMDSESFSYWEAKVKPKQSEMDSKSFSYWKGKESKQSETDSESKQSETDSESFSYREGKVKPKQTERYSEYFSYQEGKESKQSETESEYFSDLEGKENPKQSLPASISDKLKTLPIVSLKDKFLNSLPKAPMPDLSLRPISELQISKCDNKQFGIPVDNRLTLENINNAYGSEHSKYVTKSKTNKEPKIKEIQEYRNAEDFLEIEHREAPRVGDICMIGYAESPAEIYIQVADENCNSLDALAMQLSEIYNNTSFVFTSKADSMRKLGNFWTLKLEDVMYRAEVIDWMLRDEQDMVMVQLVDYGCKYMVSYKDLQPLDLELRNLPRMAQLCHLGYLYPPGSTNDRRLSKWSAEASDGFFEVLGDLDYIYFKIVHVFYCKERKSYEIDLIKVDEENEENTIGQILVNCRLAVQIIDDNSTIVSSTMKDQMRTAHGLNGIKSDMSTDDVLETYFQENVVEEAATIGEAVMHYDAQDQAETCKNLRPDGTCYKGKSCRFRHIPLKNGFTRDKEPVYKEAFEKIDLPCTNDEVFVVISHVVDIQCFYAQIRRHNHLAGYVGPTTPNNLINRMNDINIIKSYKKLRLPPTHSQMVIAKHWNSFWYRAQVIEVLIENNDVTVEVFVVDFGDTLKVPMSDLRAITPDFLSMSFQAVECRLYNVKHKDGLDPTEEKKHFERQYLGQTFKAKIMGVPGHLEVLLENDDGEDIGLKLIDDGFGELNNDHFFPADNERVLID